MSQIPPVLRMYLPEPLYDSARVGEHNFLNLVVDVVRTAGFSVEFVAREGAHLADAGAFSLFHMEEPLPQRSVTIRRAYFYPFWQIETTGKRWDFTVAKTAFPESAHTHPDITRFFRFWQKRLFGEAPSRAHRGGFVLAPLQGKLLDKRSFQTCSPIRMLAETLDQVDGKPVIATLHPKESYDQAEIEALEKLEARHSNLSLRLGGSDALLESCDYVVTQNSAVAFSGLFFEKPCILFGQSDFHHIAVNVAETGIDRAFELVLTQAPDYPAYVHWFLQGMCINAGRPEARDAIRSALLRANWPV